MEWAHALATGNDAETRRRLDNVVLLIVPSLNPDGQIMITDYYRKFLTAADGKFPDQEWQAKHRLVALGGSH